MPDDVSNYLLIAGDFVETGGMDRANSAMARFLAARGGKVHLVTHRVTSGIANHSNIVVHHVRKPLRSYFLGGPLLDSTGRRIATRLGFRPAHTIVNGGNCVTPAVNWVHYVHCAYRSQNRTGPLRRAKTWVFYNNARRKERAALRTARAIIANSERTRAHLIEFLEIPSDRVHRVYYGIDPVQFAPRGRQHYAEQRARMGWSQERPVVAFIGALGDRRKGFDTLFEAWTNLCQYKMWDADLAVIGSGAELVEWKQRAAAKSLSRRVHFLGFRNDVPDVLTACDALIAPTRYEPFGIGVQEAICMGLPAFVSRIAGVSELYPESLHDLLLPDPSDVDDLVDRLRHWRSRTDEYRTACARFSDSLRRWTWDSMASQIAEIMERAA